MKWAKYDEETDLNRLFHQGVKVAVARPFRQHQLSVLTTRLEAFWLDFAVVASTARLDKYKIIFAWQHLTAAQTNPVCSCSSSGELSS